MRGTLLISPSSIQNPILHTFGASYLSLYTAVIDTAVLFAMATPGKQALAFDGSGSLQRPVCFAGTSF